MRRSPRRDVSRAIAIGLSGCHENLFPQDRFFEGFGFLSFADCLRHILIGGALFDIDSVFGRFDVFDVRSSTTHARYLRWPGAKHEVLVDHVEYDAFLSRFPTVKFHADTSDFDGGHRDNLPRRPAQSKSSFKVSSIFAGVSWLFLPLFLLIREPWLYRQSSQGFYLEQDCTWRDLRP